MSLNSLKIATDGYLKRQTKAVLVIAVAGYLNFGGTPPIPPIPPSGGGGGGTSYHYPEYNNEVEDRETQKRKDNEKLLVEILKFWSKEMQ